MSQAVEQVLSAFGSDEFTVPDVEALIESHGIMPDVKKPRPQIAMVLKKFEDKGIVRRTYRAIGSEPHRFVVVTAKSKSPAGTGLFDSTKGSSTDRNNGGQHGTGDPAVAAPH